MTVGRKWLALAAMGAVVAGGLVSTGLGSSIASSTGLESIPSSDILTADFQHVNANGSATVTFPKLDASGTLHPFTQAADGFTVDAVPGDDGSVCLVLRNAQAWLGTDHADSCAMKDTGTGPIIAVVGGGNAGLLVGRAPVGATSVIATYAGSSLSGVIREGFWAVSLPADVAGGNGSDPMTALSRSSEEFS